MAHFGLNLRQKQPAARKSFKLVSFSLLSACTAFFASWCQASTLQLGITGDAQVGSNYIDFGQYPNGAPYAPTPGYGSFEVSLVNPGVFAVAGVTTGEFGMIQSINGPGNTIPPSLFMAFDTGGSNMTLRSENVGAGNMGPLILTNTSAGVIASMNVNGIVINANDPTLNQQFTGTFAMTFAGENVAQLLDALPADTPFSATFSMINSQPVATNPLPLDSTPEPASIFLLGIGLVVLGKLSRWRPKF